MLKPANSDILFFKTADLMSSKHFSGSSSFVKGTISGFAPSKSNVEMNFYFFEYMQSIIGVIPKGSDSLMWQ
jgi:hypothetical protein